MRSRLWLVLFGLLLSLGLSAAFNSHTATHSFSLAILPDTQKYSANYPHIYAAQTGWLAAEARQPLFNVPFVAHLGDFVDDPRVASQWQAADAAHAVLDAARMPYSVQAGNHDLLAWTQGRSVVSNNLDVDRDPALEPFLTYFPDSRIDNGGTLRGVDSTGFSQWHTFEGAGQEWLLLALDWRPAPQTLVWAQAVLDANDDLPVILTTHEFLGVDREGNPTWTRHASYLWEELIRHNSQIFLVVGGHNFGATHEVVQNDAGQDVIVMLVDYQSLRNGGAGYLRLLEFDLALGRIEAITFSPWIWERPAAEREAEETVQLSDGRNRFTIDFDFAARFEDFRHFSTREVAAAEQAARQRTAAREHYFNR